jgi:hypothetical protein
MLLLVPTLACLASLDTSALALKLARTEGKDGSHLDLIMIQKQGVAFWLMTRAIPVPLDTIAHLEQEQRKLVQQELISRGLLSPRSPPALPAKQVVMATTSAWRSAANARDHQTPKQAPQAANAWLSTESFCAMLANVFAKQAMCLLMAPHLMKIRMSTVKRWSTRDVALTSSLIQMASVGAQPRARTNAMEATVL